MGQPQQAAVALADPLMGGGLGGGRTACGVWTVRSVSENALMMGKIVKTIRVIVLSNSPFQ